MGLSGAVGPPGAPVSTCLLNILITLVETHLQVFCDKSANLTGSPTVFYLLIENNRMCIALLMVVFHD